MTTFDKVYRLMKKPSVIATYMFFVILAYYFIDKPLAYYAFELNLRANSILNFITAFGKWTLYIVLFLSAGLYFRYIRIKPLYERRSWYLLGCVFIPNLINFALKIILSRARPELLFASDQFGFYWFQLKDLYWSFPSGHAVTAGALFAGLSVIFPRYLYVYLIVALVICATRVLLYKHYLTDVMFGFYTSILVVGLFTSFLKRTFHDYRDRI